MMSSKTGLSLSDEKEHVKQSINDILTTPIGSRVMRRHYGSHLFSLIDSPFNEINRMQLIAASALALIQFEDRIYIEYIFISNSEKLGSFILDLEYIWIDSNQKDSLSTPLNFGAIS
ncbi:GPW/gp25 family protein [Acinetobacter silvestris]|uniref:Baseplate assembly protein n=1 Tax=Acinetobacter silvestris TaxID=1977882 RepID=A0A1Y3CLD4_9GAMM|nr:GPW/gp25 family protein [Acinetobacter silvestris]OTG65925.1 baseplate assembly protein [Acinetobacter silvestris]